MQTNDGAWCNDLCVMSVLIALLINGQDNNTKRFCLTLTTMFLFCRTFIIMPSLRQRMTTYLRQLSFIAEPREESRIAASLSPRNRPDDGCFITRYLEGYIFY